MVQCFPFLTTTVEKQLSIFEVHKAIVTQFVLKITLNLLIRSSFKVIFFYLLCNSKEDQT